jgi:hypothetical protein
MVATGGHLDEIGLVTSAFVAFCTCSTGRAGSAGHPHSRRSSAAAAHFCCLKRTGAGLARLRSSTSAAAGPAPDVLGRLIDYRLPRPSSCGRGELAETFPEREWTVVESGPVDTAPVRSLGPASGPTIPGFHAALHSRESPSDDPGSDGSGGVHTNG